MFVQTRIAGSPIFISSEWPVFMCGHGDSRVTSLLESTLCWGGFKVKGKPLGGSPAVDGCEIHFAPRYHGWNHKVLVGIYASQLYDTVGLLIAVVVRHGFRNLA